MSDWIVISFFTEDTPYAQEIKKLEASLIKWNIPYHFFLCRNYGIWRKNLNHKSEVIYKALDKFPDKDIVFLDADAVVNSYPTLFDELSGDKKYDVGIFRLKESRIEPNELVSNTLWFRNNTTARYLVIRWNSLARQKMHIRHQKCLDIAIKQILHEELILRVYELPFEYACIFDHPARKGRSAVIEQFQASRRLRNRL